MKINKKMALHRATLGILFSVACALAGQSVQAQVLENTRVPISPEAQKAFDQSSLLSINAAAALHAGNYAQAEAEARQAMSLDILDGVAPEVLAAALDAQGKEQEALQAYHVIVVDRKDNQPRNLLPYALLLLKSGQWKQAVVVYNEALSSLPDAGYHAETPVIHDGELMQANSHFVANAPDRAALAVAIHIARGLIYNAEPNWAREPQNQEAMAEYGKALQLAPNSALANYYYGRGWQQLSPAERAKMGSFEQAKAALTKAVKLGKGQVKEAAQKALLVAMKPQ